MIKVVNLVSLLLAPLMLTVVKGGSTTQMIGYATGGIFLTVVAYAVMRSKKKASTFEFSK